MTSYAAERVTRRHPARPADAPDLWKKKVSETLQGLNIIPEKFTGKVVVSFKEGGISYLEKSETFK
jgi:hypothetical protein